MPEHIVAAFCGLAALFSFAATARAYWEYGHETVARIAWSQMRGDTRAEVALLLRQGRLLETADCPVATLEQASVRADCIKPLGDREVPQRERLMALAFLSRRWTRRKCKR